MFDLITSILASINNNFFFHFVTSLQDKVYIYTKIILKTEVAEKFTPNNRAIN